MISVLILTKNEELDLPGCLKSLRWCDDIHVIDSGSSDRTIEIARQHGVSVVVNEFTSFAQQRNWALDYCYVKNDWILFLDADERSTNLFEADIARATIKAPINVIGFYCSWKTMLGSRWLKRSDNFPKWQFRILRKGRARFADSGHGQKEGWVDGDISYIREPYLHYAFSRGWDLWIAKHKIYAEKDAADILKAPQRKFALFSPHQSIRNAAIKRFVRFVPGWPFLRFVYTYFLRCGFLEGREGFVYCKMMMWYEHQVQMQIYLLRKPASCS